MCGQLCESNRVFNIFDVIMYNWIKFTYFLSWFYDAIPNAYMMMMGAAWIINSTLEGFHYQPICVANYVKAIQFLISLMS